MRTAVLGTGALGREHARIYAELDRQGRVEFAGIYDQNPDAAHRVAHDCDTRVFESVEQAADAAEAISIVTPTISHYELARPLLEQGRHLLVEKPMTDRASQATELVQLARERGCVLQVGHVERFNPVFRYLREAARQPRFIEAHRLSPYPARSTDIGVVLDLMIHDLDVVMAFVNSPVESVEAVGVPVLSQAEDIANARLRFANGCVANLTASRISPERLRKIRVFSGGEAPCYVSLDYRAQSGHIYRIARDGEKESSLWQKLWSGKENCIVSQFGGQRIVREPVPIEREEPLKLELESFVQCVAGRQTPVVSGESAWQTLELAFEVTRQIHGHDSLLPD